MRQLESSHEPTSIAKKPHTVDDSPWEDLSEECEEDRTLPSTPSPTGSVRLNQSRRNIKRRVQHRTSHIASPARKAAPTRTTKQLKPPSNVITTQEIVNGALDGTTFTLHYLFDVFSTAIRLLRRPLYLLAFLWLLALIIGRISHTLRGAFAPLCYLPGLHGSTLCQQLSEKGKGKVPQWADYPKLIDVQSTTFEQLLDESIGGSGLSLEIKKAEMATADLVTLVRVSDLKSKDMLADTLGEFVEDARKTGRDLQKLSSKIGGAVDNIMAVNDYALHEIEAAQSKTPSILTMYGLVPWRKSHPTNEIVTQTFTEAMDVLSASMERLILEAEVNLSNLNRLEERLLTLHDLISREDSSLTLAKSELLSDLWTILGGNKNTLRGFDNHLTLLKNLGLYRKKALAHVVAALQSLQAMSGDMEDIRERVAAPELTGSKIPVEVHMKSIKNGLERLKEGRVRARKLEEAAVRRVLGITTGSGE